MSPCIRRPCICRGASHFCVSYTIERAHCGIICLAGISHMRDECRAAPRDAASRATGSNDKECNMAAEKSQSVQDVILNKIRKDKTPVNGFLVNGVKLQGIESGREPGRERGCQYMKI